MRQDGSAVSIAIDSLSNWAEVLLHGSKDLVSRLMPSKRTRFLIAGFRPLCNCANELLLRFMF